MKNREQEVPPNGRLIGAVMATAGGLGLLVNHFMAQSESVVRLGILCLGPLAFFLGVGGMIEPKIVWSAGKYGKHLPVKYKLMGAGLAALGVVITILLVFFVYPLGRPGGVPPR